MFDRLLAKNGVRVSALFMPDGRLIGTVTNLGDRPITDGLLEIVLSPNPETAATLEAYRERIQTVFVAFSDPIPPGTAQSFTTPVPRPDGERPWDCYDFLFY